MLILLSCSSWYDKSTSPFLFALKPVVTWILVHQSILQKLPSHFTTFWVVGIAWFSHVITGSKGWNLFHDLPWSSDHGDHDPAAMVEWWERWRGTVRNVWSHIRGATWTADHGWFRARAFGSVTFVEELRFEGPKPLRLSMSNGMMPHDVKISPEISRIAEVRVNLSCWYSQFLHLLRLTPIVYFDVCYLIDPIRVMISFFNWLCWNQCFLTIKKINCILYFYFRGKSNQIIEPLMILISKFQIPFGRESIIIHLHPSGQITIIPKPELRALLKDSLTKPPFGVTSAEVAIICPDPRSCKNALKCCRMDPGMVPRSILWYIYNKVFSVDDPLSIRQSGGEISRISIDLNSGGRWAPRRISIIFFSSKGALIDLWCIDIDVLLL